ncbi:COBA2 protein, partial [Polypterus senegalus]
MDLNLQGWQVVSDERQRPRRLLLASVPVFHEVLPRHLEKIALWRTTRADGVWTAEWPQLREAHPLKGAICGGCRAGHGGRGMRGPGDVDLLDLISTHAPAHANFSLPSEWACRVLHIGHYSTLSLPASTAFLMGFSDEFSLLIHMRCVPQDDASLLAILNPLGTVLLQIRLSPSALTFITTRRRHYEFPVSILMDGAWHRVALAVSLGRLEFYVDCQLVESVDWKNYVGMEISHESLLVLGGIIETFDVPFEGSLQQLTFALGDPDAARHQCRSASARCGGAARSSRSQTDEGLLPFSNDLEDLLRLPVVTSASAQPTVSSPELLGSGASAAPSES